jgi:hypothetical protein
MPIYNPTTWVNGTTALSQTHMNNIETQFSSSLESFNPDLFSAFVLYGFTAVKDGSTANQLDVAAGVAYLLQTDGTLGRVSLTSSTQTTSTINTTYHLYLQPDATWYWSTGPGPETNSLNICSVTTDGSGNILVVTDFRTKLAQLLPNIMGNSSANVDFKGGIIIGGTLQMSANPTLSIDALGSALTYVLGAPSISFMTATAVSGSGLGTGVYQYKVTYVGANGETAASSAVSTTTSSGNQKVNLAGIPTGSYAGVGYRRIYRTAVGGSTYKLLTTILDNTTTTYVDTTADGSLGATLATHPTMGGYVQKNSSGSTVQAAIYGDGAFLSDSGAFSTDGVGDVAMGELQLNVISSNPALSTQACILAYSGNNAVNYHSVQSGSAQGHIFATWTGSALAAPFSLGGTNATVGGALSGVDNSGNYIGGGYLASGQSATAVVITSSSTITTASTGVSRVNPSGAVSSIVLQAGSVAGQQVIVVNESANTVTFAASGTSHVADGASDVIAGTSARQYVYDTGTSLWYHLV